MLPSAEALHLRRVREKSFRRSFRTRFGGKPYPAGRRSRSRRASCRRAHEKARSGARTKAGYITADTRQSKVLICILAGEVRRNRSPIRAGMPVVRRAEFATVVAGRKALVRLLLQARGQVGKASRISSMKGHE